MKVEPLKLSIFQRNYTLSSHFGESIRLTESVNRALRKMGLRVNSMGENYQPKSLIQRKAEHYAYLTQKRSRLDVHLRGLQGQRKSSRRD